VNLSPLFSATSWDEFTWWLSDGSKQGRKKLLALIKDIQRNGYNCTGHPEPLKGDDTGWFSVHIDKEDRLVFRIDGDTLAIKACRSHYGDK
jgi:toxin YoeB